MIRKLTEYIDIGVNLTGKSFESDLDDVISRANDVGVRKMIVTGTDVAHSQLAIDLSRQYRGILYATAGVHPHHADDYNEETTISLRALCRNQGVVAIGECGLDFNRNYSTPDNQRRAFEAQLELAIELEKPVFLHQRDAHAAFIDIMARYRPDLPNAVAHCFTGSAGEVRDCLELDMYIGITGWICDERRGQDLRNAVKQVPLDRIMLETDAPYLLPRDLGEIPPVSRRNEPCFLPHICTETARYMGVTTEELALASANNARNFFNV